MYFVRDFFGVSLSNFCFNPNIGWIFESTSALIDKSFPIESAMCVCEFMKPGINNKFEQSIDFSFEEMLFEIFWNFSFFICTLVDSINFNSFP